jgi:hypothetical protein
MSLINDALKQARKGPPDNTPGAPQQLQPAPDEPSGLPAWLLPAAVILLVVAAIFFIGWAALHHNRPPNIVTAPTPVAAPAPAPVAMAPAPAAPVNPPAAPAPAPVPAAPAVQTPAAVAPPATNPASAPAAQPFVLKLQGIDYSRTAPSAILNGKTVHPGDLFHQYRVKAISSNSVTLVGADNKETVVEMGN